MCIRDSPITIEALQQVEKAEAFIRGLGLRQFRVRHHKNLARIEVENTEFTVLIEFYHRIVTFFKDIGYTYVTLDLEGYRTGSMNEVLKSKKVTPSDS